MSRVSHPDIQGFLEVPVNFTVLGAVFAVVVGNFRFFDVTVPASMEPLGRFSPEREGFGAVETVAEVPMVLVVVDVIEVVEALVISPVVDAALYDLAAVTKEGVDSTLRYS